MPQIIEVAPRELVRIAPADAGKLEFSTNGGRSWLLRCQKASVGSFVDLLVVGRELLAVTDKGIAYSTNGGRSWLSRVQATSNTGKFLTLMLDGATLLAQTEKGLFFSTNQGRSWLKR